MLKQLLKKLESFIYRNDPAFLVSKKEKELRKELLRELSEEASYYTGRNISEEDILRKGKEYGKRERENVHRRDRGRSFDCVLTVVARSDRGHRPDFDDMDEE